MTSESGLETACLAKPYSTGRRSLTEFAPAILFGAFVGYAVGLAMMLARHEWILGPSGRPVPCDFLAFWAAGKMMFAGHASAAYDPNALHAAQESVAGRFQDFLYWNYPPFFFFVAALLSVVPYLLSFLGWIFSTGAAYALTIGAIARRYEGILAACASPVVLLNTFGGQNGFLSAALLGGALLLLPLRPIVAGVLLGLLAYKPQLGILVPFALIAGGHWRALWSAAATVALLTTSSMLAFGWGTYVSFLQSLSVVSHTYLAMGGEGWAKLQSVYSIVRQLGAGDRWAWTAQIVTIIACIGAILRLWRSPLDYGLKAAGLALGILLSTPYLHIYDLPVLLVGMAFLYRHRSFDGIEWVVIIAANLVTLLFLAQLAPVGPAIVLVICALLMRRILSPAAPLPRGMSGEAASL